MSKDLSGALLASSVVIMCITTLAIGMRLWIRATLKTTGLDDYLITGAWVFLLALCIATTLASRIGFGLHRLEVSDENYEQFLKLTTVCSSTFSCGVSLAKSSFAVLYLRIQPNKALRIANKCLIAFLFLQAVEESCVVIFKCNPISASWDLEELATAKCLDIHVLWWSTFVFNMTTDLFLFIQPIPAMWKLQLPLTKRIGLICMLSLGLLVCVTSIIRIVFVTRIGTDDTYEFVEPMIWSEVELAALVICSTIPCLRQVVQKVPWLNHALGLSSHKTSQNYYGQSGSKKNGSIPLKSFNQSHKDYLQSNKSKNGGPYTSNYGLTSKAVGGQHTKNDSTEEIFPHKTDGNGAIMVTHEVMRDVESHTTSSPAGSVRHDNYYESADKQRPK
ncbi:hypothetical protein BGZ61DRAFT_586063 [Ilyonectria robusta]|uniref:uncharacterized protein n=1 Tax=Ilyonectria robusta TaxID=1079257 RepID=UPI001E8D1501|nr:uncharacterized protein BGZ61DRAFT_586063 [Ilyonectria robusta]KAH8729480.1 hypothetical protein BGZ61DRAFT_586063 [Ilyonectria robusta]